MLFGEFGFRVCGLFCCGLRLGGCAYLRCCVAFAMFGGFSVVFVWMIFGWFEIIVCVGVLAFGDLTCGVLVI